MLKAGWGPLTRVGFAIEAGIAKKDCPSSIFSLVRLSRITFARKHHPAYEDYLRRTLEEEKIDMPGGEGEGREGGSGGVLHPLAWGSPAAKGYAGVAPASGPRKTNSEFDSESESESGEATTATATAAALAAGERTRTAKLENAGAKLENVVSAAGDEGEGEEEEKEEDLAKRRAMAVAALEDVLGSGRKARMAGVKDRPPNWPQPLGRLWGSPQAGDALLDLGQEEIVAYDSPPQRRLGA